MSDALTVHVLNKEAVDYYIGYFGSIQEMHDANVQYIFTPESRKYFLELLKLAQDEEEDSHG